MISANSHLIAFAAERSRITGETVNLKQYVKELQQSMNLAK